MKDNEVLKTIRDRRSVIRFLDDAVHNEDIEAVLEAGRWAPSYINSQPCEFVVVRGSDIRSRIADIARRITVAWQGFATAPVVIAVVVDPQRDPTHFLADGAACVQNMVLAAQSLGLASFWAGLQDEHGSKGTPQAELKALLGIPVQLHLVALVPLGHAAYEARSSRRPLGEIAHGEQYGQLLMPS